MKLLSVSLPRHDGSIAYFDSEQVHYVKLERIKQDKRFAIDNKWSWIYEIKQLWNIDLKDIDEIIFDFHAETFYDLNNLPPEITKVLLGETNVVKLEPNINVFNSYIPNKNIYYIGHHYAHSLSTWMLTDSKPDLCVVIDGVGDHRSWSIFKNDKLIDRGLATNGSIGGSMMASASILGIKAKISNDLPGKLMGLQSYGTIDEAYLRYLQQFDYSCINDIFSIARWYNYKRSQDTSSHQDWIKTVHKHMENVLIDLFKKYASKTDVISYSGGVAQNVIWNTELKKHFKNLIIPPHAGDEGLSLGALEWLRIKNNLPPFKLSNFPYIQSDTPPNAMPSMQAIKKAAEFLAQGKTVGWYQDKGEAGPRALGNRSILMDPRLANGKDIINGIKNREYYRPFGASVLKEYASEYFDLAWDDDFMLYTASVKSNNYPAITHVDGTCRVQTVDDKNPVFKMLLTEFYNLTGCPILLNTSLNLAGKPLAGYPEVAKDLLATTALDSVFIGNEYFLKY